MKFCGFLCSTKYFVLILDRVDLSYVLQDPVMIQLLSRCNNIPQVHCHNYA